jgi:protein SCO1/2
VVSVDRAKETIEINHEAIPGLMEAMVMPFTLRDRDALQAAAQGDGIQATLVVTDEGFWLENPVLTKGSPLPSGSGGDASGAREPQVGEEVPDFALVNQDGRSRRLQEYRGRALLLTFIFTRCPQAEFCPLMSSNFAEINRELEKDPALGRDAHLLSVTIDPAHDTPKVLRSYGAAHTEKYSGETFEHWEFATGEAGEIRRLANFFGLTYNTERDQIVHSLRTILIGADGRVAQIYRGNQWKPAEVVADLRRVLTPPQTGS